MQAIDPFESRLAEVNWSSEASSTDENVYFLMHCSRLMTHHVKLTRTRIFDCHTDTNGNYVINSNCQPTKTVLGSIKSFRVVRSSKHLLASCRWDIICPFGGSDL